MLHGRAHDFTPCSVPSVLGCMHGLQQLQCHRHTAEYRREFNSFIFFPSFSHFGYVDQLDIKTLLKERDNR